MLRQYVLLIILIVIGVWSFSLTQNVESIMLWIVGFGILVIDVMAIIVVLYRIRTASLSSSEEILLHTENTNLQKDNVKGDDDGKK